MSCRDWEERIALQAGGDLPAAEAAELERHLSDCPACRETAEGQRWGMELLREEHEAPIPAAVYTAVRARVLAKLERQPSPVWRRVWICAVALAAVALVFMLIPRRVQTPVKQAVVNPPATAAPLVKALPYGAPSGPGSDMPVLSRPRKAAVRRAAARRPAARPQPPAERLMVKLLTDDPNVIIYWISD